MKITRNPSESVVKELLKSAQLPTSDITPKHMEHFFGAWDEERLEGVVGVEILGSVALLRSFAVVASKQYSGLGSKLLSQAEQYATEKAVKSIYLLTTAAQPYFQKRGYSPLVRESAPASIRNTAEFSTLCPTRSVLMVKQMSANTSST